MKKYLTKSNFILLLLVVIAVLAVLLMSKDSSDDSNTAVELYKLENFIAEKNKYIQSLENDISVISDSILVLSHLNDSLYSVKNKVKIKYREIYIDIPHYTNSQLDSVIRSNW